MTLNELDRICGWCCDRVVHYADRVGHVACDALVATIEDSAHFKLIPGQDLGALADDLVGKMTEEQIRAELTHLTQDEQLPALVWRQARHEEDAER